MSFNIKDRALQLRLERHLARNMRQHTDSIEKLSSGSNFSTNDPRPADRALAEGLEYRLRGLASNKRNINTAVNLIQTAESSLSEITNMILRMKEINVAGASTTLSDSERRFLFIEYEALHDEINRIATTTEFNGLPLLNGEDPNSPEELVFRVGDPFIPDDADEDINVIRFDGIQNVVATTLGLGVNSARDLLADSADEGGLAIEDVEELMLPEDDDLYETTYDQALETIATQRAVFGGLQARLQKATDFIDVYQENIAAAKSTIADVDYAEEIGKMTSSKILLNAGSALLSQGNIGANLAMNLIGNIL